MKLKINHQNVFFTSDQHFSHANIIKYDKRPFETVEEMDEELIKNWNSVVSKKDIVIYAGDLSFDYDLSRVETLVDKLNGNIHAITGNHDRYDNLLKLNRFVTVSDYLEVSIKDDDLIREWQEIMIFHYPILSWNKEHHGAWHLHGHCHQSLCKNYTDYYKRKVIDIGCNGHNYTPLSYKEIKDIMKNKETSEIGHHKTKK